MSIVKSNLLDQLADNYPSFFKKDLDKFIEIILKEIENSLKQQERVEMRDIFTLETRIQKPRVSRNPKTNEKINTPEKKTIHFKMSKGWAKKINEKD